MSTKELLSRETPDTALQKLLEGNERFRRHEHTFRDFMQEIEETKDEQFPFAAILGCMDSRVPVEILFDQGIGQLFVLRVAGNIENDDIIAGLEYACSVIGSKLIVVMGHENCGAVKAACDNVNIGHITEIVKKIKPSIEILEETEADWTESSFVNEIAKVNVMITIDEIREKSCILRELEQNGQIKIVGAYYHVHSGTVEIV
jgi:carbonic anhydrase